MVNHSVAMGLSCRINLLLGNGLEVERLHPGCCGSLVKGWHRAILKRVIGDQGLLHGHDMIQVVHLGGPSTNSDAKSLLMVNLAATRAIRVPDSLIDGQMRLSSAYNWQLSLRRLLGLQICRISPPIERIRCRVCL